MQNLDIVRNLYGAFAARDRKAILEPTFSTSC